MADWLTYKGQSPWVCIPVIKNTYDEGDKTTSVLNPVWVVDQDGVTDRTKHDPCGYWPRLPYSPPPPVEGPMFEVYHEMLPAETAHVWMSNEIEYVYPMETFISFDPLDFDGVVKFEFEIIGMNKGEYYFKVALVDADYTVCHELILPANTEGTTGYELFRIREEFTPIAGSINYGLKFIIDPEGVDVLGNLLTVVVSNARIIVTQSSPTKTRIQIPMFGSEYVYAVPGSPADHISYPEGVSVHNQTSYTNVNDYTNKWPGATGYVTASDKVTNVWMYSESDLKDVSKVTLSVLAKSPMTPIDTVKTIVMISSAGWSGHSDWGVYTTPTSWANTACSGATSVSGSGFENIVWQDGCTGAIFTPVPNSQIVPEPDPWDTTVYPDLSGISGSLDVCMGWMFSGNPWQHGALWFTLTVNPGRSIIDEVMTVVPGSTNLKKDVTLTYKIIPTETNPLYVALFDITTNSMVAGSEQSWIWDEGWVRKDIEIPTGNMVSGHEYEFRVKCVDHYVVSTDIAPEIADVQLLINVTGIENLTTWHRVFHRADNIRDNWYTPVTWGGDYWEYGYGANCIMHRAKVSIPEGATVMFEQVVFTAYDDSVDEADYQYISLLENGVEIEGSKLVWTNTDYNTRTRKRSGVLPVINDQVLGSKYGESEDGYIFPIEGFVLIKVI